MLSRGVPLLAGDARRVAEGTITRQQCEEVVHRLAPSDMEREVGTHLYGRRMYETMVYWETAHTLADSSPVELDYAHVWQAADKVVYFKTLETVSRGRTRIERGFDAGACRGRRGHPRSAGRRPPGSRAPGRTPFWQRHGAPQLPRQAMNGQPALRPPSSSFITVKVASLKPPRV